MDTCEFVDVSMYSGAYESCKEPAIGISDDGIKCCEAHAAGLRAEGFIVGALDL